MSSQTATTKQTAPTKRPKVMTRIEARSEPTAAELVNTVSQLLTGALTTAAVASPESPRRTDTLPLIKLIRAIPRPGPGAEGFPAS